jgi:hypothetical protein
MDNDSDGLAEALRAVHDDQGCVGQEACCLYKRPKAFDMLAAAARAHLGLGESPESRCTRCGDPKGYCQHDYADDFFDHQFIPESPAVEQPDAGATGP